MFVIAALKISSNEVTEGWEHPCPFKGSYLDLAPADTCVIRSCASVSGNKEVMLKSMSILK